MTPGLETGVLIGGSSLITMIIAKCRCYYKHATIHPFGCGFTDVALLDDNEISVKTTVVNGVELLYINKANQAQEEDLESNDVNANRNYCSYK